MAIHIVPHHVKRQTEPLAAPTATGLDGSGLTQVSVGPTPSGGGLALDPSAPNVPSQSVPNLGITITPVSTIESPPTTTSSAISSQGSSAATSSSSPIPISTVIGACVGTFIGVVALIILSLWFYRRYSKQLKYHARSRRALNMSRNVEGDHSRRRSHLEPWNRLEDGDVKWEGMYQAKEVDNVAPMEKLTMFKKSPSVRTAYTHKSDEPVTFDLHPFAQYTPNVAQELAYHDKQTEFAVPRNFLGRVDTGPTISWDGASLGGDSFLRSERSSGVAPAIPTPPATTSQLHRWESAEVVQYEESIKDNFENNKNPFEHPNERRKSFNNPFFNATSDVPRQRSNSTRSRSNSVRNSTHSRSTSVSTVKADVPKANKGKERAVDSELFDTNVPRPFAATHNASSSVSSASSNDRAMQSLIAALDVTEQEIQERLRVASLQPSVISAMSAYTSAEEEDVTRSFPLPPS